MRADYFFSSSEGDIPVSEEMMQKPFILRPLQKHSFLTLGDFFHATRDFLWQGCGERLFQLMNGLTDPDDQIGSIQRLIIRYEKYGTLYQIVSAEAVAEGFKRKFAVIAALLLEGKETLEKECNLLDHLHKKFSYSFIPKIYFKDKVESGQPGKIEIIDMALANWFEEYHEWHFSGDKGNAETIAIWDMERGFRSVTKDVIREIIRQASKILTLYYDPISNHQIYPWHHGPGDFVVKADEEGVDVRLISVRGYEAISPPQKGADVSSLEPLLSFFLSLTVKMRIDKFEGMGDPVWAGAFILPAVLSGFLEGLEQKEAEGRIDHYMSEKMLLYVKEISRKVLHERLIRQIEMYREIDPVDFSCMEKHIEAHAEELQHALGKKPADEF
jgi:hypothetical protein